MRANSAAINYRHKRTMSDQLLQEFNDQGELVGYSCALLNSPNNVYEAIVVPYYYDLVFNCGTNDDVIGKQLVETSLLTNTASLLRMRDADGGGCLVPPPGNAPWIARLQGDPVDDFETSFDCVKAELLQGECCSVVKGAITMYPIGAYQIDDLKGLVAVQLDDSQFGDFRTYYLGAEVERSPEDGMKNVAPAISEPEPAAAIPATATREGTEITVVGGFIAGGLVAGLLGVMLVLLQRRKRILKTKAAEMEQTSLEGEVHVHVSVHSDEDNETDDFDAIDDGKDQHSPFSVEDDGKFIPNYKFDLGDSFKNEIAGMYGAAPSSMAVVAPYPMEETSDSEVDSWAQTEGTVGSLEERLEEITAEI